MALHEKDKIKDSLLDDVYASSDLSVVMPKYKMPEKEHDPRHAYQVVHDELMLDGNARQNLATFCQTWLDPEVHQLMDECIDKNMIDKDEYPQSAEIENRCVHMSGRSVELAGCRQHPGLLHHRLQRGRHAGRHGHEVALAGKDEGCRQTHGQAQHGLRSGAGLLAQVCPLLGRGTAGDSHGGRSPDHDAGRGRQTLR